MPGGSLKKGLRDMARSDDDTVRINYSQEPPALRRASGTTGQYRRQFRTNEDLLRWVYQKLRLQRSAMSFDRCQAIADTIVALGGLKEVS